MKKENHKMTQNQRALSREKKAKAAKRQKILTYAVPAVIILILVIIIIADAVRNSDTSSDSSDTSETASYSTDTSLTIADGDTVNIDYTGTIDGVEFDGGSTDGTGTDLTIGSGSYIDDFEDQLIGAHPGDEVDVTVTFPDDYQAEDLQGKEAVFAVTVNGIYED